MSRAIDPTQFVAVCDPLPEAFLLLDPKGYVVALNGVAKRCFAALRPGDHLSSCMHDTHESIARVLKLWRRAAQLTPAALHTRSSSNEPMRCEGAALAYGRAIILRCRHRKEAATAFVYLDQELDKLQQADHALRHDRQYLAQRMSERTVSLRESERRLRDTLDALAEAVVCFDDSGHVLSTNSAADQLFGFPKGELAGTHLREILPEISEDAGPGTPGTTETFARHREGSEFAVEVKVRELPLQDSAVFTAMITDITERKAYLHHLKHLAERDFLTSLYNRRFFGEEMARLTRVSRGDPKRKHTILFVDLDNFKFVNDELGHGAGDHVLKEIAALLQRETRGGDLLGRLGGDEFALLLCDVTDETSARVAERIRSAIELYVYWNGRYQADVGCSIGVARFDQDTAPEQALSWAEFACRQAKSHGRNCVWTFTSEDAIAAAADANDMGWARRIKRALNEDLFELHEQPIACTATGEVIAHEMLIRLREDRQQLIMPGAFLPAAERFGLMPDVDRWVIGQSAQLAARTSGTYSVNLSATTLAQPDIGEFIAAELSKHGARPEQFVFEVTETAAVQNLSSTAAVLEQLRSLGCRTALDDFGVGMSSFAYLRALPVDWIKIDGRFVRELATNDVDRAMVKAMHDIAGTLGKRTVAEFVEDEAALRALRELGVDLVQGYHVGRPAPITLPDERCLDQAE